MKVISIYVAHDSDMYINRFAGRHRDELGDLVYAVNSNETSCHILDLPGLVIIDAKKNVGFSRANNLAMDMILNDDHQKNDTYVVLVNPDVFLPSGWLSRLKYTLTNECLSKVGLITVPLIRYDFGADSPDDVFDSVGMDVEWYGRWYDRMQGEPVDQSELNKHPHEVTAACGALMVFRLDTLCKLKQRFGYIFDESYFMYKEDVELSLRVKSLGMKIYMLPQAFAYHCRGWRERRQMSYISRYMSASNEVKMHMRYHWRFLPYSLLKLVYVISLERLLLA